MDTIWNEELRKSEVTMQVNTVKRVKPNEVTYGQK